MSLHRTYEPATGPCSGGPTPGARGLMAWFLGAYTSRGGVNSGIYNCRNVRGSSSVKSLHAKGRACDFGIRPYGADYGDQIAQALVDHSGELGVQLVIWNRRVWSAARPDAGWRPYNGMSPHEDHIHVELSVWSAANLTAERVQQVLGGARVAPARADGTPRTLRLTNPWMRGEDVRAMQRAIGVKADGIFGPGTDRGLRAWQRARKLVVDGQFGPASRRAAGLA